MNNLPPPPPPEFLTFQERNARDIQRATQQLREMPRYLLEQHQLPLEAQFSQTPFSQLQRDAQIALIPRIDEVYNNYQREQKEQKEQKEINEKETIEKIRKAEMDSRLETINLDDTLVRCFKYFNLIDNNNNAIERNKVDLRSFMKELRIKLDALYLNESMKEGRNSQSTPPKLQILAEKVIRKPSNDKIFNTPDNRALLNETFERLPNVDPYAIGKNVLRSKTDLTNYIRKLKEQITKLFKEERDNRITHLIYYKYTPSYIKCKTNGNKTQVTIELREPIGDSNSFHERIILDDIKISSNFFLEEMLDNIEHYLMGVYEMLDDLNQYDGGKKKSKNKSKKKKKSRKTKRKMNKKSQKRKK
tara:strand:- start:39 stop:1121 length:1083 start_codon:yes stop_codon:yes gene_type:complete